MLNIFTVVQRKGRLLNFNSLPSIKLMFLLYCMSVPQSFKH